MTENRESRIRAQLEASLEPTEIFLKDQSHLHEGHAGAQDGRGHFDLTVVSEKFVGLNRIQRHRMVYDSLNQLLETDIHALRIKAYAPSERS